MLYKILQRFVYCLLLIYILFVCLFVLSQEEVKEALEEFCESLPAGKETVSFLNVLLFILLFVY